MNLILSMLILLIIFYLYKYTYFFQKRQHKGIEYGLSMLLPILTLVNFSTGYSIYLISGFTWLVGVNFFLAFFLALSWGKILELFIKNSS